ncbi:MAG: ester cyclase [Anaerolineae bacterium]
MDENQQRVNQLVEAWNSHDLDRVAAHYSSDCYVLDVAIAQPLVGREAVRLMFEGYYMAFPDLQLTPTEIISDGDRVALFWTAQGTHQGSIMQIPPSGRAILAQGVNRLVLNQGLVCETSTIWDVAGMLRGIGLLPDLS